MGSLSERAKKMQVSRFGGTCTVSEARKKMTAEQCAEFDEALADEEIHASVLAELLRDDGIPLSDHAVRRHRSGKCRCAKLAALELEDDS